MTYKITTPLAFGVILVMKADYETEELAKAAIEANPLLTSWDIVKSEDVPENAITIPFFETRNLNEN